METSQRRRGRWMRALGACLFAGLLAGAPAQDAGAEYGDVVINNYWDAAGMRPVVFPHWFHRVRYACKVCHADLGFRFKAGGNEINMLKIIYDKATATDTRTKYLEVCYKDPKDFMELLNSRVSDASNVSIITDPSGLSLNVYTDRAPQFYTSFTDDAVVCDSYDSAVETYLRTAKTQCFGRKYPSVTLTDGFYFDLPTEMFSYLLAEAKSVAFGVLKQTQNPKAEQQSTLQRRRMSWESHNLNRMNNYPNFGRRSKK